MMHDAIPRGAVFNNRTEHPTHSLFLGFIEKVWSFVLMLFTFITIKIFWKRAKKAPPAKTIREWAGNWRKCLVDFIFGSLENETERRYYFDETHDYYWLIAGLRREGIATETSVMKQSIRNFGGPWRPISNLYYPETKDFCFEYLGDTYWVCFDEEKEMQYSRDGRNELSNVSCTYVIKRVEKGTTTSDAFTALSKLISQTRSFYREREGENNTVSHGHLVGLDDGISCTGSHPARTIDELALNEETKKYFNNIYQRFINSKEICDKLIIDHKEILLLPGPPGTGKTTIANAFAKMLGRGVLHVNLNSLASDSTFNSLRTECREWVILIDDIHRFSGATEEGAMKGKGATLLGLLDFLGGAERLDGAFIVITTNDIDKMPEDLKREHRYTAKYELPLIEPPVAEKFIQDNLGYGVTFTKPIKGSQLFKLLNDGHSSESHMRELIAQEF